VLPAQNGDLEGQATGIYVLAVAAGLALAATVLGAAGLLNWDRALPPGPGLLSRRLGSFLATVAAGMLTVLLFGFVVAALANGTWSNIVIDTPTLAWCFGLADLGGMALGLLLSANPSAEEAEQAQDRRPLSWAALVLGLLSLFLIPAGLFGTLIGLAALTCGLLALRGPSRARTGSGQAIAGCVLGAVSVVALIPFLLSKADESVRYNHETIVQLGVSQCVRGDVENGTVAVTSCRAVHDGEVYAVLEHEAPLGTPYPGPDALVAYGNGRCEPPFADYVGIRFDESALRLIALWPSENAWQAGVRHIVCVASRQEADQPLVRSVRGSQT